MRGSTVFSIALKLQDEKSRNVVSFLQTVQDVTAFYLGAFLFASFLKAAIPALSFLFLWHFS